MLRPEKGMEFTLPTAPNNTYTCMNRRVKDLQSMHIFITKPCCQKELIIVIRPIDDVSTIRQIRI
jgi:hypothetical protein